MRVYLMLLIATVLTSTQAITATTGGVDSINNSHPHRHLRENPKEERGMAKAFTYIKKWPAERNWAKAEELVKRDASVETLFKKTKIHPEILAKLMGPEKLSKQAIVKPSLNDYVDTQILKFKEYETLWKKSKGVL
ncbi:hypothetical protein JG688_00003254 [Phytophthora aleatoria]|uniref:RxLR effector protein n=1 Tax=Phytophthora aleatoria TaxID=2496075 RepID=A0A8J5ITN3_9STRA|nr:hypothetical protein JG688_00003254 [Phytophthora aleatoria]